jgi:hypothetical protein
LNQRAVRVQRLTDRLRAAAQPWEIACFFWVPTLFACLVGWYELRNDGTLGDMPIFRAASRAVLHGSSPYAAPNAHALAGFDTFVYPPAAAYLFAPLAVVPYTAAKVLILALGVASVIAALRLLDVQDWRCYGVAVVSAPVVNSLALGAFSSFLVLGTALVWRYRDRSAAAGVAASLTATVKLFLWPLGLWLLVTRRMRAAAVCAAATLLLVLSGWAAIGMAGFGSYPRLLRVLSQLEAPRSFSVVALLGLSGTAATAASALLCVGVAGAMLASRRGADADRRTFTLAVLGALVATPVVWLHYYALVLVPIALFRPRLSGLWFVPLALWLAPSSYAEGVTWRILLALTIALLVGAAAFGFSGAAVSELAHGARGRAKRRIGDARVAGADG